jgi:hypothetical protein
MAASLIPLLSSFSPCIAAPGPFGPPKWMQAMVIDLGGGKLSQTAIDTVKKKYEQSYKSLTAITNRVNSLALQGGIKYRLNVQVLKQVGNRVYLIIDNPIPGKTYRFYVQVIDSTNNNEIVRYVIGNGTYDP